MLHSLFACSGTGPPYKVSESDLWGEILKRPHDVWSDQMVAGVYIYSVFSELKTENDKVLSTVRVLSLQDITRCFVCHVLYFCIFPDAWKHSGIV